MKSFCCFGTYTFLSTRTRLSIASSWGQRLEAWDHCESRRGYGICSLKSRVSKGSDND